MVILYCSSGAGRRTTYAPLSSTPALVSSVTVEVASLAAEVAGLASSGWQRATWGAKHPFAR